VAGASARPRRWRRRLLVAVAVGVLVAVAVRVALTVYAADLFVFALARALAGSGAEVVFAEPPTVSLEGFESKGVQLRSVSGQEWARADEASGTAHLLFHEPYVSVALTLKNARAVWTSSSREQKKSEEARGYLDASLPPSISAIELEHAVVDLGERREVTLDASITAGSAGSTTVEVTRLDYAEPAGERAGEKLAGTVSVVPVAGAAPKIDVRVSEGAVLLGTVLYDFGAHPLTLMANVDGSGTGVRFTDASFALGKLLAGTGGFLLEGGALVSTNVRLISENLEPAFATLVREPFAGVAPALSGSELRGRGSLSLEMSSLSRHRSSATATLALESLETRSLRASALSAELPWIGAEQRGAAARTGRIRAKSIALLGFSWSGIDVPLDVSPGRLRAKSVQEWTTTGGSLRVTGLAYDDDAAKGPRLSGDVEVVRFDLRALGEALGRKGLSGSVRGNLGRVVVDSQAVSAPGSVAIDAWGGTVTLSRLSVENPFGRVPELGLDALVREIDLESLTAAFGFGRVSGVLEGHVTGLVIADGQPQAFDADLHTVERRGVSQKIDVRAIAQLGALGGDTGSLTGSLLKVIDRYRYSAMGVRCRLRNDVFEIRGVESRDGRDYLVKGSRLPPSVSVVSHSQVISFSEMLRRVERITDLEEEGETPDAKPKH
jgi:hypothetical protein